MQLSPDLKQNLFYMVYFVVKHNFLAVIYVFGIIISISLAIYKPSRANVLLILGFSALLLAFEFSKHIAEPLYNQTITSLITIQEHYKLRWILDKLINKIIPFGLNTAGICIIGLAIYLKKRKTKANH